MKLPKTNNYLPRNIHSEGECLCRIKSDGEIYYRLRYCMIKNYKVEGIDENGEACEQDVQRAEIVLLDGEEMIEYVKLNTVKFIKA